MKELTTQKAIEHLVFTGYSKYRIAKMLGVQPIMLTHYERGHIRMSQVTADKMRAYYGIIITDAKVRKSEAI